MSLTMKVLFHLIFFYIYSLIIVNGTFYYGFRHICHQIAHHAFHFHDNGAEQTRITDCKLVNIEVKNYGNFSSNTLEFKILYENKEIESLKLYKTDGLLANGNTPIYFPNVAPELNYTNFNSEYFFEASTIHQYAPELGNFSMYHDRNKTASMMIFRKLKNFHVDGNVGNYILRRLPHIPYLSTKYAYIRIKNMKQEEIWDNYVNNTNLSYDLQVPEMNNITINLLVILDSSSVTKPRVEVIRTLLMYFNYIDMFHGNFTSPKIQFSIKGIVLPPTVNIIPYLGNNRASTNDLDLTHMYKSIRTMYKVHQNFFDLTSHDIITVMTQRKTCDQSNNTYFNDDPDQYEDEDENCYILDVYSNCICEERSSPRLMVAFHSDFQGYHGIFLDGILSILGYADETDESLKNCTGIGGEEILNDDLKYPLAWSACNIQQYSNQFRKFNCSNSRRNEAILADQLERDQHFNRSLLFYKAFELIKSTGSKILNIINEKANLTLPHNKN